MPPRRRPSGGTEQPLFDAPPSPGTGVEDDSGAPLAARMRPRTLDELVGQEDLLGPGSVMRRMIVEDRLRSILLFGPPGTGKTSLARLVARATDAEFVQLSAVTSGVADVRKAVADARTRRTASSRRTVVFIDEVHRFNRTQQDALLPAVESGEIVFIGATTENPFFSVTSPLLSRCTLFRLERLEPEAVRGIAERALTDPERGLRGVVGIAPDALDELVNMSEGDARVALNAIEAAADRATNEITIDDVRDAMRQRIVRWDRAGDAHYDAASAFIKSMRGSDPNAALAWLARMIAGGEDPRFIARRMVIFASEDIGLADSAALSVAVAAANAVEVVGLPEVQLNLAHAAVYLALAPKSNAVVRGIGAATDALERRGAGGVPAHLRGTGYSGAGALGHGVGYKYPHDYEGARVEQRYMPEGFEGDRYWEPEETVERPEGEQ